MQDLLKKLEAIHYRFKEVGQLITDPAIISDMQRYVKLNKEYKDLEEIDQIYHTYKNVLDNIASSKAILAEEDDPEMKEMAKMELDDLENQRPELEEKINKNNKKLFAPVSCRESKFIRYLEQGYS